VVLVALVALKSCKKNRINSIQIWGCKGFQISLVILVVRNETHLLAAALRQTINIDEVTTSDVRAGRVGKSELGPSSVGTFGGVTRSILRVERTTTAVVIAHTCILPNRKTAGGSEV
jgi:hypothetical protein